MKKYFLPWLAILSFIFNVNPLTGQKLCWLKYDVDSCKTRVITEFGISKRVNSLLGNDQNYLGAPESTQVNFDFNVGVDTRISDKMALGGVMFLNLDQILFYPRFGIRPRLSYFPNDFLDVNISPGVILTPGNPEIYKSIGGISFEGGVNYKNHVGLYTRIDFLNRIDDQRETSVNFGVKTGGSLGTSVGSGCLAVGGCVLGTATVLAVVLLVSILTGGG